jgi:hypothetical protein
MNKTLRNDLRITKVSMIRYVGMNDPSVLFPFCSQINIVLINIIETKDFFHPPRKGFNVDELYPFINKFSNLNGLFIVYLSNH